MYISGNWHFQKDFNKRFRRSIIVQNFKTLNYVGLEHLPASKFAKVTYWYLEYNGRVTFSDMTVIHVLMTNHQWVKNVLGETYTQLHWHDDTINITFLTKQGNLIKQWFKILFCFLVRTLRSQNHPSSWGHKSFLPRYFVLFGEHSSTSS